MLELSMLGKFCKLAEERRVICLYFKDYKSFRWQHATYQRQRFGPLRQQGHVLAGY